MKYKIRLLAATCISSLISTAVYAQQMEDGYTWIVSDNFGGNSFIHYPSIQFDTKNANLVYAWFKDMPTNSQKYFQTQEVIDCSNLLSSSINLIEFDRLGRVIDTFQMPIQFTANNPNSVGEAKSKAACAYKANLQRVSL